MNPGSHPFNRKGKTVLTAIIVNRGYTHKTIEVQLIVGTEVINEQVIALAMTTPGRGKLILLTTGPLET